MLKFLPIEDFGSADLLPGKEAIIMTVVALAKLDHRVDAERLANDHF